MTLMPLTRVLLDMANQNYLGCLMVEVLLEKG